MNRRHFLALGVKAAAGFVLCRAVPSLAGTGTRRLSFYHTHTRQTLDIIYARSDIYDPLALDRVNYFLRLPIPGHQREITWQEQGSGQTQPAHERQGH